MYPFLESIRLEHQKLHFMPLHEARFVRTQKDNWGRVIYTDLQKLIQQSPGFPGDNTGANPGDNPGDNPNDNAKVHHKYKCRVVYSQTDISIQFIPYTPKVILQLKTVTQDPIDYHYKSTNRKVFEILTKGLASDTEILIFKNGLLTDSSFSNLALYDGNTWWTPKSPLLSGVHRRHLLDNHTLKEVDITMADLPSFQKIKLINAMMDWEDTWQLPITAVEGILK